MTAALEGGECSAARPGRILPPGKTRYSFYRRLGGPSAGLDGRKISSPPGFNPGPSSPWSVAISTELPGPQIVTVQLIIPQIYFPFFLKKNISALFSRMCKIRPDEFNRVDFTSSTVHNNIFLWRMSSMFCLR